MSVILFKPIDNLTGAPLAGVLLSSVGGPGPWQAVSDADGICRTDLSPGDYTITFSKAGYANRTTVDRLEDPGEVVVGMDAIAARLSIVGRDFLVDGQRVVLNGTDQFCAYEQCLDGVDLEPLFTESRELNFNTWRVFLTGSIAQNGILELRPDRAGYYEGLRPFADLLTRHGIVLLATAYVDNQDVKAGPEHWTRVADGLRGSMALLSGGNEWSKNGFDPRALTDPGMLWSRGSDVGDAAPVQPYGSFAEFHPRRDLPAALMDTVASPCFIYQTLQAPLIIDEPPRMGANGSGAEYADPAVCYKFARHYATECAGAVFHSRPGQSGVLMDPQTRACAEAWSKGMRR